MHNQLVDTISTALDALKARDVTLLDVRGLTDVTDYLVVASATSSRHLKSLAQNLVETGKKSGFQPIGVEGMESADWVLVDYGDAVVHIMMPETRQFYELEKLWSVRPAASAPADNQD